MRRGGLDGVSLLVLAGQAGDEVADDDEGRIEFKMINFDFLSGRSVLLLKNQGLISIALLNSQQTFQQSTGCPTLL